MMASQPKDWTGNANSIWKTLGASNHTEKERQSEDYYATDSIAIDKLLQVETPNENIWEPAACGGHLSSRLSDYGFNIYSTDIVDRGYPLNSLQNFLFVDKESLPFGGNFDIITNPPYSQAKDFVLKALELLPDNHKCYMFLKLTFLEGKARYNQIFSTHPPRKVYVFSERVMCAKNGDFQRMKEGGGSAVAYAWFVWQKGFTGSPEINWI